MLPLHNKKFATCIAILLCLVWFLSTVLLFCCCLHDSELLKDEIRMLHIISALSVAELLLLLYLY